MALEARKRSDGRETMERLISFAEAELNAVGPIKFNLINVLEKAGVSRSSAYHHFHDRDGLIAAVEAKNVVDNLRQVNEILRAAVEHSNDPEMIIKSIEFHLTNEADGVSRAGRQRRVYTLTAAQTNEKLAEILSDAQRDTAAYLADTISLAHSKKLIAPRSSPLAIAHWILSLMFGRVLVDVAQDQSADSEWLDATMISLRYLLNPAQ